MTDDHGSTDDEQERCDRFVELLTDYLDGTLPADRRRGLDRHLLGCEGCQEALAQWRSVAELAGRLTPADVADLDPYVRDRMMSTFLEARRR